MSSMQAETVVVDEPPKWLWWVWLILGVLTVGVGIALLISREFRLSLLLVLLAVSLFFNGISEMAQASARRSPWVGWVLGVLFVLGGFVVLGAPRASLWAVAVATGVVLLTLGALQTVSAFTDRAVLVHWKLLASLGVLTFVAGFVALVWPKATVLVLAFILGIRVLLFGIVQIGAAIALRQLMEE